jgi:hypothetical protein
MYSYQWWCWNQPDPDREKWKNAKGSGFNGLWKEIRAGQSFRLDVPTYGRDYCEVQAVGVVDERPVGRLTVKIRDR